MSEHFREHYFTVLRLAILLFLEGYIMLSQTMWTGASVRMLLLLAFFSALFAGKELPVRRQWWIAAAAAGLVAGLVWTQDAVWLLLLVFWCYELLLCCRARALWYVLPVLLSCIPEEKDAGLYLVVSACMGVVYWQHIFVVAPYQERLHEDELTEQHLKHDMDRRESELQETVRKNLLQAENQLLEERAALAQTLHDKLGHNINGSVYQLEAVKLLMETQPQRAHAMVQAVIDQLRTGMDEIRAILRRERPEKYRLALLQLEKLCGDCRGMGVDAQLLTEGEMSDIPEPYLEVILDNAYEAVSNAMKYAKCTRIGISVRVLNRMIRCTITDNGVGCEKITDGMGIAGMRRRVRTIGGIIDFETEAGFTINMLLPLREEEQEYGA